MYYMHVDMDMNMHHGMEYSYSTILLLLYSRMHSICACYKYMDINMDMCM